MHGGVPAAPGLQPRLPGEYRTVPDALQPRQVLFEMLPEVLAERIRFR